MIRIKTIHIEEFRGIRDLDLNFDAKNFGICGPNGTGKSGIVDSIEFCITGDVTRLSGQGSAGLSVKAHAPHVDQHKHPEKANVTITADIPSLGKSVTIHRSVKNPKIVSVTPNDADVRAVIGELQTHPEFALSRREIVKYIITPPGKRSEDVQTLLRLDHIEKLRKSLTTYSNKRKTEADAAESIRLRAETDLSNGLEIERLERKLVLKKVNDKRRILGFPDIAKLEKDTSFIAGIAAPKDEIKKPTLRKATALADISALQLAMKQEEPSTLSESRQSTKKLLGVLKDDHNALTLARQHMLIRTGLDLITENACPLCDTKWDAAELLEHLRKKLLSAEDIGKLLEQLQNNINAILQLLSERAQAVERTIHYSQSLKPPVKQAELVAYVEQIENAITALTDFLNDHSAIEPALKIVSESWWSPAKDQKARVDECYTAVSVLPDLSTEDEARQILAVAQERYEKLLSATKTAKAQRSHSTVAAKVLNHYNDSCTVVLEGIYDDVAKDFSNYYQVINREDEDEFVGKLSLTPAKLSFDVDFYGRGLFPPGAYHSEGHQDSMGLCLYLALMKRTLGNNFTFAVLDDVLMSVDTGHRREICRLLKSEFPNTQFILTTHDRVWLQYMKTESLIVRSQTFAGWTVEGGPRVWDDHDAWTVIQNELDRNEIAQAASLLRRYLEYTARILADNFRSRVEFRRDGDYDLGDLLPGVLKKWKERLEEGEKSAIHWKRDNEKAVLFAKRAEAKVLIAKTNMERWAINPSVHFNEWENFQPHEFQDVVNAYKELLESLRCENENCKSYLYVSPRKGTAEEMRCTCGATTINFRK